MTAPVCPHCQDEREVPRGDVFIPCPACCPLAAARLAERRRWHGLPTAPAGAVNAPLANALPVDLYRFQRLLRETLARLDAEAASARGGAAYTLGTAGDTSATDELRRAGAAGRTALDRETIAAGPGGAVVVSINNGDCAVVVRRAVGG